jgi:prolyl oligopeptidase
VTDILHGVPIPDPYRWLEDQESPQTRDWLAAQSKYARAYFCSIAGRDRIRKRVSQIVDVDTYDSLQRFGNRYFFRKRVRGQEQPCIYCRDYFDGPDHLLIDPALRGGGPHTSVKPLRVSPDGSLLLYEVKQGGERSGSFELLDIPTRTVLPDVLPRGYLRGFAFAPDSRGFYYVHEPASGGSSRRAAYQHVLGSGFDEDSEVFFAGADESVRLHLVPGKTQIGFLVYRFGYKTYTDFYVWPFGGETAPQALIRNVEYKFGPTLLNDGRILAITDRDSPNLRIVEVRPRNGMEPEFRDLIPARDLPMQHWVAAEERIFVSYLTGLGPRVEIFNSNGHPLGELPLEGRDTVRLTGTSEDGVEVFFEAESFTKPIGIYRYSKETAELTLWAEREVPLNSECVQHTKVWFTSRDGTQIPMFLVGRSDVLEASSQPTILTSYGGYGVPMTPQFSLFVAFLVEHGCLFALPNIRGGTEFGTDWHNAAKRQNRQVAFDDFLTAAEWLIQSRRTDPAKLAIFGASNSGLLVGVAMTQRPELFRAVLCMVPILDMLRYHLFDDAHRWKEEFGTSDDGDDFAALVRYSPYHNVHDGTAYPATMIVSGDSDQNCNPLHARKMTARLQAASTSDLPILLDYSPFRGHSPVLPLSMRVDALTDRLAFFCNQLELKM